jgi:choline dehydrogenase-like flavoprotein
MERFNGLSFGALHLVIIGGGFCGTMVALNLARTSGTALRVTVINCGRPMGRGIAYGTTRSEHLLNVAARNMSAFPEHPNHFVEWLQTRTEFAGVPEAELRERFIPRRVYGDYLRGLALHFTHPVTAGPRPGRSAGGSCLRMAALSRRTRFCWQRETSRPRIFPAAKRSLGIQRGAQIPGVIGKPGFHPMVTWCC